MHQRPNETNQPEKKSQKKQKFNAKSFKSHSISFETDNKKLKVFKFISHGDMLIFYTGLLSPWLEEKYGKDFRRELNLIHYERKAAISTEDSPFDKEVIDSDDPFFSKLKTYCKEKSINDLELVVVADANLGTVNGKKFTFYADYIAEKVNELKNEIQCNCDARFFGFSGGDDNIVDALITKGDKFNAKQPLVKFEFLKKPGLFKEPLLESIKEVNFIKMFPVTPVSLNEKSDYYQFRYKIEDGVLKKVAKKLLPNKPVVNKIQPQKGDIGPNPSDNYGTSNQDNDLGESTLNTTLFKKTPLSNFFTQENLPQLAAVRSASVQEGPFSNQQHLSMEKKELPRLKFGNRCQSLGDMDVEPRLSPQLSPLESNIALSKEKKDDQVNGKSEPAKRKTLGVMFNSENQLRKSQFFFLKEERAKVPTEQNIKQPISNSEQGPAENLKGGSSKKNASTSKENLPSSDENCENISEAPKFF